MTAIYEPAHLKLWTMPDSYFGAVWPGYYGSSVGQTRDSDALARSNFRSMLKALGGESETVIVVRENHWACGWVEWIAIHMDDSAALEIADTIAGKLEDYPVVNDDDWSQLEDEDAQETWKNCYDPAERAEWIRNHRSQFDFSSFADMLAQVRGEYFGGYASELLS